MHAKGMVGFMLILGILTAATPTTQAADTPPANAIHQTPPRLSFTDGQVSFWRPGAQDWVAAQVNTPLAPGDELYAASPGNLEIQIGPRAFVRIRANTQLGFITQEPDYLQFKVTTGVTAIDLRSIKSGHAVEIDTPNAAFTIEHPGYYRVDVTGDRTSFVTRRGGRASIALVGGQPVTTASSEEVVIEGSSSAQMASYAAPALDVWDQWNYARTDGLLDAMSARYVSPGTYGVSDLDPYGTWRAVPTYGSVWVPTDVPAGWVPYSTGAWTLDPHYGWTWVDTAPWGWAPYHYGRWVFVDGFWAWAPGPVVARPIYAPALVAFFGGPRVHVGVSIGGPFVGWVALGWGEPVVPWWGRVREPSWRGWGGPRVVNNTVINNTTVVNVQNINVYRNASAPNAVVAVNRDRFGHGPIDPAREIQVDAKRLQPIHTAPQVSVTPASFVSTVSRGVRPPEESVKRTVVATRAWHPAPVPVAGAEHRPATVGIPAPRVVVAPQRREAVQVPARPPLGRNGVERPRAERDLPPPPRAPENRAALPQPSQAARTASPRPAAPPAERPITPPLSERRTAPHQMVSPVPIAPQLQAGRALAPPSPERHAAPPQVVSPAPVVPRPQAGRAPAPRAPATTAAPPARPLPGEPVNRLAPHRAKNQEWHRER